MHCARGYSLDRPAASDLCFDGRGETTKEEGLDMCLILSAARFRRRVFVAGDRWETFCSSGRVAEPGIPGGVLPVLQPSFAFLLLSRRPLPWVVRHSS